MVERERCCGCGACFSACPRQCIEMISDRMGFLYPHINRNNCVNCGVCEIVCPALQKSKTIKEPEAWGGYSNNQNIRKASSSGGIFTLLAQGIIEQGGVVFGAAFTKDNCQVKHICIDNINDLHKLRGSKYVQSSTEKTFTYVKELLEDGIPVMYSGTPCQIEGLNLFLQKEYTNILTVEIICHGVPSPKLFKKYIVFMEEKLGAKIRKVFFRDENEGGGILVMRIETDNGTVYREDKFNDPFFRFFLRNNCLRESCYNCPSRGLHKRADITLSDFWGVENCSPDLADGGGISLVLMHTEKGRHAFNLMRAECIGHAVDFNKAIEGNKAFYESYTRPDERTKLENDIDYLSFEKLFHNYGMSWKGRFKRKVLKLFNKK